MKVCRLFTPPPHPLLRRFIFSTTRVACPEEIRLRSMARVP
jgi:hypothetical protein